ncbi:aldehyde dehydrogenase (NAD(P)(+)) ald5 [Pseudogymnoascus verrucosus]|uniref:aldehyde dehydrogenase (NAD(+)) n=1 Tax=Pseudogymnoascus verrucosus TaxID=342668 RepID=A0A1B8GVL5_9PEZI|nr:aldehyde dehydrogenase (NAD(P)(+)) ald5 [Pseudogymnoascus verrucosus]OBT99877.1 aldehyde dehydrogenase (NAD(P)(+)) ald5 [Pseudogymnoascus verrucosus]
MATIELKTLSNGKYQQPTRLFINNEFIEGVDKKSFKVINPATEKVICSVAKATEKDVDVAVAAARKAFKGEWRKVTPEARGKLLVKLSELMEANLDQLAAIESLDNGKAISMAKGDVAAMVSCLRYYSSWSDKIEGKTIDTFTYTL